MDAAVQADVAASAESAGEPALPDGRRDHDSDSGVRVYGLYKLLSVEQEDAAVRVDAVAVVHN